MGARGWWPRRCWAAGLLCLLLASCSGSAGPPSPDLPFGDELGSPNVLPDQGAAVGSDPGQVYEGRVAARASVPGGPGNKYARTVRGGSAGSADALRYGEGDDLWYGTALFLPEGFHEDMQAYFSPLRWDNFGAPGVSRSGLVMYDDDRLRLVQEQEGVPGQRNLLGDLSFRLDEGRWYWLEVHQRLSEVDGEAENEVFVDGRRIGRSTTRNYAGDPVTAVRYGIVALSDSEQLAPLTLWYDRVTLTSEQVGPADDDARSLTTVAP